MLDVGTRAQLSRVEPVEDWLPDTFDGKRGTSPTARSSFPDAALIVVIESDRGLAFQLLDHLCAAGLRVQWESSGAGALVFAESHSVDLAIFGLEIPDMDAAVLCRRMRERSPAALIALSRNPSRIVRYLVSGADDCVVVPYEPAELMARVRAILLRRGRWTDTLRVGTLHIDGQRALALAGGRFVHLTRQELAVLTALASRPDRLIPRSQLTASGEDHRRGAYLRAADSIIARLRHKLLLPIDSPGPDGVWIETLWGVGYAVRCSGDRH